MKRKIALLLIIIMSLIAFAGCNKGGWRVDSHSEKNDRTIFYLSGNGEVSAEYTVQSGGTTLVISWASSATTPPVEIAIEIYCDGIVFKEKNKPMLESFFAHAYYQTEPNSRALSHKFTIKPMAFQYEEVQIIIYGDGDAAITNKTFPVKRMIEKVTDYANKKKVSLS